MTDQEIIEGFLRRDEAALTLTEQQYGRQCRALSRRILGSTDDAEECVNEAYFRLWDSIPPAKPASLYAYLSRIVRNLSLDRLREAGSLKRGGSAVTVALDELAQVAGSKSVEDDLTARELGRAVERFLRTQKALPQGVFIRRYYFFESREEIAARYGISAAQVSVQLSRTRKRLAQYLQQEGLL